MDSNVIPSPLYVASSPTGPIAPPSANDQRLSSDCDFPSSLDSGLGKQKRDAACINDNDEQEGHYRNIKRVRRGEGSVLASIPGNSTPNASKRKFDSQFNFSDKGVEEQYEDESRNAKKARTDEDSGSVSPGSCSEIVDLANDYTSINKSSSSPDSVYIDVLPQLPVNTESIHLTVDTPSACSPSTSVSSVTVDSDFTENDHVATPAKYVASKYRPSTGAAITEVSKAKISPFSVETINEESGLTDIGEEYIESFSRTPAPGKNISNASITSFSNESKAKTPVEAISNVLDQIGNETGTTSTTGPQNEVEEGFLNPKIFVNGIHVANYASKCIKMIPKHTPVPHPHPTGDTIDVPISKSSKRILKISNNGDDCFAIPMPKIECSEIHVRYFGTGYELRADGRLVGEKKRKAYQVKEHCNNRIYHFSRRFKDQTVMIGRPQNYILWQNEVTNYLSDKSLITDILDFPHAPTPHQCENKQCRNSMRERKNAVCEHTLKELMEPAWMYDPENPDYEYRNALKFEIERWDPANFDDIPEVIRKEFKEIAAELYSMCKKLLVNAPAPDNKIYAPHTQEDLNRLRNG